MRSGNVWEFKADWATVLNSRFPGLSFFAPFLPASLLPSTGDEAQAATRGLSGGGVDRRRSRRRRGRFRALPPGKARLVHAGRPRGGAPPLAPRAAPPLLRRPEGPPRLHRPVPHGLSR